MAQINFCHFFPQFELKPFFLGGGGGGIFTMKMNGQWVPCERNSAYSFMPIHLKLYMCYGHGLKICMWFGYNPWFIFCHFFHNLNLVVFSGILVNG